MFNGGETADLILFSGDERPKAHRRSDRSEGASAGASERTGHADEHRALAADQPHAGTPEGLLKPGLSRSHPPSDHRSSLSKVLV